MRHGKQLRFVIREAVDFAGFRLYAFLHDQGTLRPTHVAKPMSIEFEPLPDTGDCVSLSPLTPTLMLSYETVHRDRVFDQMREALAEAGLQKDHRGLEGELRATKDHVADLSQLSKTLASVRCHRCG
jgi:hypothetical protein